MPLINHAIPSLFNGVSQQAASIRQPSQCEAQENAYSSIVEGVHKRHPTVHVAKLSASSFSGAYVHTINRDTAEKYEVVITNGGLAVWDINGNQKTVTFPQGTLYLNCTNPQTDFSVVTIADYTFIVNKTKTVTLTGGNTNGGTATWDSEVQQFSKLPATGTTGLVYRIRGDNNNAFGAYYTQWDGSAYVECPAKTLVNTFDAATMPHQLVRNSDGTFTFAEAAWDARLVGDNISASPPSFVGRKLGDIFFFRNRLGVLADENVVFSRAGMFFNFWPETATQVLDTDPVDNAVSHTKVSLLRHAIPFNKNLLLFSDLTQFVLSASDILTPKSAVINQTTEFECSSLAKPVACGSNVYFSVDRSGYTGLREYYITPYQLTFDADDVSAHAPRYVPGSVFRIAASTNEDVVFMLSANDPSAIYVYKFYWAGDQKAQSAWFRWNIDSGASILSASMMNTKLFLVVQRSDGLYLEYIDIQTGLKETDLSFTVNLDRKVKLTGSYSSVTGKTTWTLPYPTASCQVVLGGSFTGRKGSRVQTSMPTNTTVEALGDFSSGQAYIGVPYTMRYRFSPQFAKDANKVSIAEADLKLRNMKVFYTNTGYFRAEVTPMARETYSYLCMGKLLGTTSMTLGDAQISSGVFQFPVGTDGMTAVIELVNDSYLPSFFQSAEWMAFFSTRSQRM